MKTIKDTPRGEDKPTHKVVFNQIQKEISSQEDEAVVYCEPVISPPKNISCHLILPLPK